MSGSIDIDATRIWNERYAGDTHVGTKPVIAGDPIDYTQHKFLYQYGVALPSTGRLDGWIIDDAARSFLTPPPKSVLALGSGMAFVEEMLLSRGYAERIIAYEASENACDAAMQRIRGTSVEGRLEMRCADVLKANLPDGAFDLVFVQAAIHHFERIDDMFALMHRVLKPDGLLLYDEYVGPDHHQYSPEVMEVLNLLNDCLGSPYKFDTLANAPRERMPEPNLDWMIAHDPSEGVHASRILPLTYQWFDVLKRFDYGGTLLRPFFTGILRNFNWDDAKDQTVARLIILIEQLLLKEGVIPTYHTHIVARRRAAPLPPLSAEQEARIGFAGWQPILPDRQSKKGVNGVRQVTAKSRYARALATVSEWCRRNRHRSLREQHTHLSPAADIGASDARMLHDLHDHTGLFKSLVERCYTAELRAGSAAVDGGALVGMHTGAMARLVGPAGHVLAFEPVPDLAAGLRRQFAESPQVVVHEKALSDREGLASFQHIVNEPSLSSLLKRDLGPPYSDQQTEVLEVMQTTLDCFANIPIRFIKLDLEGYDYFALLGARTLLAQHRPIVAFEFGGGDAARQAGFAADEFFGFFAELHYSLVDLFGRPFGPDQFDLPWNAREVPHIVVAAPAERQDVPLQLRTEALMVSSNGVKRPEN